MTGCMTMTCRLVPKREVCKPPREESTAQECAERFLGQKPMQDYHSCLGFPSGKKGHGRLGTFWAGSVMKAPVHFVNESKEWRQRSWAKRFQPASDVANKPDPEQYLPKEPGWEPVYCDSSFMDVLYEADEFGVHLCRTDPTKGEIVFVEKGDYPEVVKRKDCNLNPASREVAKLNCCMLGGPGGNLCTFTWSSGTGVVIRLDPDVKLWWDLIPEKLSIEDMPDGKTPEQVRAEMAATKWTVRNQQLCVFFFLSWYIFFTFCYAIWHPGHDPVQSRLSFASHQTVSYHSGTALQTAYH